MINFKKQIENIAEIQLKYAKGNPRALDLGCGEGKGSLLLAEKGFFVDAIDKNIERILKFKEALENTNLQNRINIVNEDFRKLKFKRNYYDFIICVNLLHLLSKKDAIWAIKKIYSSLKPNSTALILFKKKEFPLINNFCKFDILYTEFFIQNNEPYLYLDLKKPPPIVKLKRMIIKYF